MLISAPLACCGKTISVEDIALALLETDSVKFPVAVFLVSPVPALNVPSIARPLMVYLRSLSEAISSPGKKLSTRRLMQ